MKKGLTFLLLAVIILSLIGCGNGGTGESSGTETQKETAESKPADNTEIEPSAEVDTYRDTFSVGFARVVITPQDPVPMAGYGNNDRRISKGYLEDLLLTCVAIADGEGGTMLLFSSDLQNSKDHITEATRSSVSRATGIPTENILLTATHTHSGVDLGKVNTNENVAKYVEMYEQKLVDAALQAIRDMKPAEMYWGTADLTGYNFVKHYFTDLGEVVGDNYAADANGKKLVSYVGKIVRHTTEANGMMYVLKFEREGDKTVYLLNWRAHPNMTGGSDRTDISADYVAPLRETIEAETGGLVSFYEGEAGNMNATSRIADENVPGEYTVSQKDQYYVQYGTALGKKAVEEFNKNEWVKLETGPITTIQTVHSGKANHTTDKMATLARPISQYYVETNDTAGTREMCVNAGFASIYAAQHSISRTSLGATYDIEIHATKIGNFMMVHCPNEIFDTLGLMIRDGSPSPYLFVIGYSNEQNFYIPSQYGFEYGCYEADCTNWAPGEGEVLVQHMIELLKELDAK